MTIDEVKDRLAKIDYAKHDDQYAHSLEDELHQDVLLAIATFDCGNPAALAKEALKTLDINFYRWCD